MKSVMQGVSRGWWLLVLVGCLSGGAAYANPANCDDDMTEDQRWTADLCSAHAGCRLVFGIMDSCIKAKSFLSRFGTAGSRRASSLTDDEVGDVLVASGVPRSGLSSCLFSFDRAKCLEFLSGGPKPPSAKEKADALAEQLNSGVYNTTRENSALGLNRQALRMCEEATSEKNTRDAVRARERCALAEKGVQNCMSRKQSHDELRVQLQGLIGDGSLGADAARYSALATTAYPECPTTLPGSGKTPQAALAEYLKFWDTPAADVEPKGEVALPRRGGNSGGDRFRQAITQADQEERERPSREARERAERDRIAAAEASLTPQQRLARSFDERISAARQQCAASESSCNTGCLGIGAVGLISLFSRNSAGASAASDQVQQCSSRCDQEKSACDQQVVALEQEKLQAMHGSGQRPSTLGNVSGGGGNVRVSGSGASGAGGQRTGIGHSGGGLTGNECLAERSLLVNASYARSDAQANQFFEYFRELPDHPKNFEYWAKQSFRKHSCTIVPGTQDRWRRPGGSTEHVVNCYQDNYRTCLAEARYEQIQRGGSPVQAAPSAGPASGNCKTAYDRQEAEFTAINRRAPRSSGGPVMPSMQVGLYMTGERLKLLDQYCRGEPQYAEYAGVKQQYDAALRACRQIATDSRDCVGRIAY